MPPRPADRPQQIAWAALLTPLLFILGGPVGDWVVQGRAGCAGFILALFGVPILIGLITPRWSLLPALAFNLGVERAVYAANAAFRADHNMPPLGQHPDDARNIALALGIAFVGALGSLLPRLVRRLAANSGGPSGTEQMGEGGDRAGGRGGGGDTPSA